MRLLPTISILVLFHIAAYADIAPSNQEPAKGLLNEIQQTGDSEEIAQKKSFQSEVLIIKSETKAIEMLQGIIKKRKNTPEEPDLLFRLAELYMRRSKSGRFFDLNESSEIKLKQIGLARETAYKPLNEALRIYEDMIRRFPKYDTLDAVYFNAAMAYAQTQQLPKARQHYGDLISKFPKSPLVPDALLEAGEIDYQKQLFTRALEQFKAIEEFKNSKAYPYGLYKSAWCYYNLKQTDSGINQLLEVLKINPIGTNDKNKYNLRQETLRDLTLFGGENLLPQQVIGFFRPLTNDEEFGSIILALTDLYESHSRFKEISIFADEFIERFSTNPKVPELYVRLIQTHETLKNREAVIEKMKGMSRFCQRNHERNDATDICFTEFKKVSLEISKKWWEIWLKNKTHEQFSELTQKAFEILLENDTITQPDSASRYAYADLLFQIGQFDKAQKQYELISLQPACPAAMKHDALYGSLFSVEKMISAKPSSELTEKQKVLSLRYIEEFKTGEYIIPITFKLGLIAYQQAAYDLSLRYLNSIVSQKLQAEFQLQTEDMILDIYNIKKDYVTLLSQIKKIHAKTENTKRRESLILLQQQAHYAIIANPEKNESAEQHIEKLMGFSAEYRQTPMAQTAHWQAIAQAYAAEEDFLGAQLSEKYYDDYPTDSRNTDSLKEALKVYIDSAHINEAIRIVAVLSKLQKNEERSYRQLECQLTDLLQQKSKALTCYAQLFNDSNMEQKKALLPSYLSLFEQNKTAPEYSKLQQQLLNMQIEPYATQILIVQAQTLLEQGQAREAFQMSLKINARNVDEGVRAEVRVLQARILEDEFRAQSLKTREDKLSLVLAMKAEKLDKSLTAYTSALKMSNSEPVQKSALEGIDRLYSHFISAIQNIVLPETLSAADRQQIQNELKTLIAPFNERHLANRKKMAELNNVGSTLPNELPWQSILASESDKKNFKAPSAEIFESYYFLPDNNSIRSQAQLKTKECRDSLVSWEATAVCAANGRYAQAEKMALKLAENKKMRALALYTLSVMAYEKQELRLSKWLIEKSVTQNNHLSLSVYQQARLDYTAIGLTAYFKNIDKMLDIQKDIPELSMITGLKAFSERDYKQAKKEFSRLTEKQIYNYGMNHFLNFTHQQSQLSSNVGGH